MQLRLCLATLKFPSPEARARLRENVLPNIRTQDPTRPIEVPNLGAKPKLPTVSAGATISPKQLDKKWKHAIDFGITTTKKNTATLADYGKAIANHLDNPATVPKGTYLYVKESKVYFNPNTNLVVVLDSGGNFVTGWKLTPGTPQFSNFMNNGVLR
jgi:hypothetical protein